MLFLFVLPIDIVPQIPDEKGLSIVRETDTRNSGFEDFTSSMLMTLRNKHGEESIRKIHFKVLEVKDDGDKSITIFDNPRDVKGTAFLNFTHKVGDDDQWLYLPALKRVKRISSSNKSGSFMGSEFAYEDIGSQEVEKYTYKWIRDDLFNNEECYVVEYLPVDKKNSGYTKQVTWIDKNEYRIQKVEYYDRKNSHLKTLSIQGYKKYLNKYWKAEEMVMVNHQNGKSTQLQFSEYRFSVGLKGSDFTKNALKRTR
jgi:outer membrane lipoprotein-sorting protein